MRSQMYFLRTVYSSLKDTEKICYVKVTDQQNDRRKIDRPIENIFSISCRGHIW